MVQVISMMTSENIFVHMTDIQKSTSQVENKQTYSYETTHGVQIDTIYRAAVIYFLT